jgi:hypothetical protein
LKLYQDYANEWAGLQTSVSESIFVTQNQAIVTCWNCGEQGHRVTDCTKPRNADMITKNKETYQNTFSPRGKRSANRIKFAPATPEENNRRIIDGKPWIDDPSRTHWDRQEATISRDGSSTVPPTATAPPTAIVPPFLSPLRAALPTVAAASHFAARDQALNVAVTNAMRNIASQLSGLAD